VKALLFLESDSVYELLEASRQVEAAVGFLERAKGIFAQHGLDFVVNILASVTVEIGKALAK
jgi:hypothetical protein